MWVSMLSLGLVQRGIRGNVNKKREKDLRGNGKVLLNEIIKKENEKVEKENEEI
jgi:hypothetical protein